MRPVLRNSFEKISKAAGDFPWLVNAGGNVFHTGFLRIGGRKDLFSGLFQRRNEV